MPLLRLQLLPLVLVLAAAPVAFACGGSDEETGGTDTWRIGLEAPLSGDQSALGKGMLEGAQLAATQLNAEGGLLGKSVFFNHEWVPYELRQNFLLEADAGVSTHFEPAQLMTSANC